MKSRKQVKDLQINLKSIRLDFFWKNKNVCMIAGLVGVRGAGKQRAGSFSPLLFKHLPRRLGMNMLRLTWKTMKFVWFGTLSVTWKLTFVYCSNLQRFKRPFMSK